MPLHLPCQCSRRGVTSAGASASGRKAAAGIGCRAHRLHPHSIHTPPTPRPHTSPAALSDPRAPSAAYRHAGCRASAKAACLCTAAAAAAATNAGASGRKAAGGIGGDVWAGQRRKDRVFARQGC
eukprot:358621-Chlamydomonas_euryale.AAC.1